MSNHFSSSSSSSSSSSLSLVGEWISKNDIEVNKSSSSINLNDFNIIFEDLYSTKLETFLIMSLIIQQLTYSQRNTNNTTSNSNSNHNNPHNNNSNSTHTNKHSSNNNNNNNPHNTSHNNNPHNNNNNNNITNIDEISLLYRSSSSSNLNSSETIRTLKLTALNFITTSSGIVFAVNINLDSNFYNYSTLLMGPRAGFRIFEQYKLSADGSELFSNFTITNRQIGNITIKKRYSRRGVPFSLYHPFSSTDCEQVCSWKSTKSHSSATIRSVTITISQPDWAGEGSIIYFPIIVSLPNDRSWIVKYRYSQLRHLKTYLREELDQLISLNRLPSTTTLPHFPPREIGTISNRSLEERRLSLEDFLNGVVSEGGYDCQDIVDVLAAFLEIPAHYTLNSTNSRPNSPGVNNFLENQPTSIFSDVIYDQTFTIIVNSTRLVDSPMFENVSVFHWIPHVEYEILVTRYQNEQPVITSVFRRYKEITKWLSEVQSILQVTHPSEELASLNLPSHKGLPTVNTPSIPSKVDLNGEYVKMRIDDIQRILLTLINSYPHVISLPVTKSFLQLNTSTTQVNNNRK